MQRVPVVLRGAATSLRTQVRHGSGFKTNKELDIMHKATMDFLPKPSGSWQTGYQAKDMKANVFLAVAVVAFAGSIVQMHRVGCFDLLTNPAKWNDAQIERQAKYYAMGEKYRKKDDDDDE